MSSLRRQSGVTLIELMVAVAISLLAITAIYSLFVGQTRSMRGQQETSAVQENARIALDVLSRDIRNAGFALFQGQYAGIRIENDCGAAGHQLGLSGSNYSTGASDLIANGEFMKTDGVPDTCPNGTDRITLAFRPRMDVATACSGSSCVNAQADPTNNVFSIICRGSTNTATGDCCLAMEAVCDGCSLACMAGGACTNSSATALNPAPTVTVCAANDPSQCVATEVVSATCNQAVGGVRAVNLSLAMEGTAFPNSAAQWALVGGKDSPKAGQVEINGIIFRTYQLLDPDGAGPTPMSLVFSDRTQSLERNPGTDFDARWTTVATGIEDLQFAYALTDAPTAFVNNTDLWNIPTGCTASAGIRECMRDLVALGSTRTPHAIRVSLIARSGTQELSRTDSVGRGLRRQLEDHNPAENVDDNIRGFKRRVLTEVIGLRNF